MLTPGEKFYRAAIYAIFGVTAVLIVLTFRQYGITWDEELQSQYGQAVVDYYFSGFKDQRYAEIFNLYLYGGMFDGLASLIDRFTPFSVYETRHLVNGFFGLLGLWGTWRLGRFIGGNAAGLVAVIMLALTPVYYGHMFNNPKDIPFATGIVWTLYFMARCYQRAEDRHQGTETKILLLKLGIVLGLTLGVRVGGVMIVIFWLMPMGLRALAPLRQKRDRAACGAALKTLWQDASRFVLPAGALGYAVMLLCWPWAQQSPIANPLRALSEFSNFPQAVEVLLNGTTYMSTQLPWFYVPLYFAVQLPEFVLLPLLAGFALMPWIFRRLAPPKRQALMLVLLMAFVPMLYAMIRRPALYDAVRHFMFAVPLMCVTAALAARHVYAWAIGHFRQHWSRRAVAAALLGVFIFAAATQIVIMARLHPYEYIYANRIAGGVPGAYGKYELDYWGSSFKEAAEKLQAFVAHEGGVPPGKIYRVAICGPWDAAMIYLPPDYEPVEADQPADFFLSTTRWMCQNMRPGKDIVRIERFGVPLSVIKDLRGGHEIMPKS